MLIQTICAVIAIVSIESAAMSVEKIAAVRCFETNDTIVVAALTEPLYSHKEIVDLKKRISAAIKNAGHSKRILVTFDLDIYSKINDNLKSDDMQKIIKTIEKRS